MAEHRISVIPFAHVSRVVFQGSRAIGVEVIDPVRTSNQRRAFGARVVVWSQCIALHCF